MVKPTTNFMKHIRFPNILLSFPKSLLHNRWVLYALCILALVNIVMYANVKDFNSVATLLIIGFLVSFFSKNMIIILAVAVFASYILNFVSKSSFTEGARNMKEEANKEEADEEEDGEEEEFKDKPTKKTDDAVDVTADEDEETSSGSGLDDIASGEAGKAESNTAQSAQEKKKMLYDNLQTDFQSFQKTQDAILKGMQEIDPLLTKAESFIQKFEHYSKEINE
jgi:hypothetical protein